MGIVPRGWDLLYNTLAKLNLNLKGLRMCELGNQLLRDHKGIEIIGVAKDYFIKLGVDHVSIDVNGKDGSLPIDLCKEITDNSLINTFDIVTNYGTGEHVDNQYMLFKNMHNLCKRGGIFIIIAPHIGYYKGHGSIHYTMDFFDGLIDKNNYTVINKSLDVSVTYVIFLSMVKDGNAEFMLQQDFDILLKNTCWFGGTHGS